MRISWIKRFRFVSVNGTHTEKPQRQSFIQTMALLCLLLAIVLNWQLAAFSRSQWDIQHPTLPPGDDGTYQPGQMPGQLHTGVPPQMSKNFWQGQFSGLANSIPPGVVLTGILENNLSSSKNKAGDIFAITLQEGYVANGMQVIPQNSKIVGAVTAAVPSKMQQHGQPGNIQVSLQSLVLPDGTHLPFAGFISSNPNHAYPKAPKKRDLGFDLRDTGANMAGMLLPYTSRIGYLTSKKYRGNDFKLDKGEAVPVRLNQMLVVPDAEVKPVAQGATPNGIQTTAGMTIPYGASPSMVPGLTGPDNGGAYRTLRTAQPSAVPGLVGESDPFSLPVNQSSQSRPLSEMPEPF